MPHLDVYVDARTLKKIRAAARKDRVTLSKWVRRALTRAMTNSWPEGYFEVLGSLAGSDLSRPDQGRFEDKWTV
jgi:hypothetical protein